MLYWIDIANAVAAREGFTLSVRHVPHDYSWLLTLSKNGVEVEQSISEKDYLLIVGRPTETANFIANEFRKMKAAFLHDYPEMAEA